MPLSGPRSVLVLCMSFPLLALLACGTASPAVRTWEGAEQMDSEECEHPRDDACVVFACDGELGECGLFGCEAVEPEAVAGTLLTHGARLANGGGYRPVRPPLPPSQRLVRDYRRSGIRQGARPRMTFHFRYSYGYLPAFPNMNGSRLVKHHLFPQAEPLARWFLRHDINIHAFTMVVPEHLHLRVHSPGGRGGPWNAAWRDYMNANLHRRHIPRQELLRKALELAFRFDITGPIVPYYSHFSPPPGPQLFAAP